jgi:hypothetical protein
MPKKKSQYTWMTDPDEIIFVVNQSGKNLILDLPAGYYRLDAGRRMQTLRSIVDLPQIKALIDQGKLSVEAR